MEHVKAYVATLRHGDPVEFQFGREIVEGRFERPTYVNGEMKTVVIHYDGVTRYVPLLKIVAPDPDPEPDMGRAA